MTEQQYRPNESVEGTLSHRKTVEMGRRIRQLEASLATIQTSVSSEPHPLLRGEYRNKFPFRVEPSEDDDVSQARMSELADELGTLDISEGGHSRYVGTPGRTEVRPIVLIQMKRDSIE